MIATHRAWSVVAAGLLMLLALGARPATGVAGEPSEQLRRHIDRALEILKDPGLKGEARAGERRAALRKIAEDIFDLRETAKRALGRHWQARIPAERDEFVRLFTDVLEAAYMARIEQYSGQGIQFTGESIEGEHATVQTRIPTERAEIPVAYRMQRVDGRWRVYDVVIEGVSLIANYRTQFHRIIESASYRELVERLRARPTAEPASASPRRTTR